MDLHKLVKQEIINIDPMGEVILFGSRAREDFREDSDWDFLIILDRPLDPSLKEFILRKLYDVELRTDSVISSLIHSKREWEKRALTPLYKIIKREGKQA